MLDILFVHPNASKKIYQALAEKHSAIEPPIWAGMLANSVRSAGYGVEILDAEAERLDFESAAKKISEYKARIICLVVYGQQPSASSQNMSGACATAAEIKKLVPDSFILFVGGHVAALPEKTLLDEPDIDAVCQNEGVYTIRQLLCVPDLNDELQLSKVNGLCFRNKEKKIISNKASAIVAKEHLEEILPGVAWDLLPAFEKYRTAGWHSWSNGSEKEPFAALINIINRTDSSPGISSENSNVFRWWSPEFIIKQFDHFAREGVRNVKIADELFVLNPNHFIKICDLIIERGYDFNIWAYSRIDTCKPIYLDKLKRAGINWLGLGIENPSATLRREIHKDGFADVKIVDVIKQISSAGINVGANYIFGLPHDTLDSMNKTLEFAMENMTEMTNMYCAMAYPGSPLYLQAKAQGITLPQTYSGYSQHSYDTQNLPTDNLTAAEILSFRDSAWHSYHEHPRYLSIIERKFGDRAKTDIVNTSKIRLKRKLLRDEM